METALCILVNTLVALNGNDTLLRRGFLQLSGLDKFQTLRVEGLCVIEVGWRPCWECVPPTLGELVDQVNLIVVVDCIVRDLKGRKNHTSEITYIRVETSLLGFLRGILRFVLLFARAHIRPLWLNDFLNWG